MPWRGLAFLSGAQPAPVRFKSLSQLHCRLAALWFSPAARVRFDGLAFRAVTAHLSPNRYP